MKKLYRRSVTVHPSPPPPPPPISDHNHLLSLLPAAILALTAALSPQDTEVLAYLISCNNSYFGNNRSKNKNNNNCDHPPCFTCYCFRCYMSYWVRWDSSPNRQLIHEIIDAFEDGLVVKNKNNHKSVKGKNGRDRRKRSGFGAEPADPKRPESSPAKNEPGDKKEEANTSGGGGGGGGEGEVGSGGKEELEKGSVRSLVSFIGERIWGVWN